MAWHWSHHWVDFVSVVRFLEAVGYVDVPKLRPRVHGKAMALYERTWSGVVTREETHPRKQIVSSVGVPTDHFVREMCPPGFLGALLKFASLSHGGRAGGRRAAIVDASSQQKCTARFHIKYSITLETRDLAFYVPSQQERERERGCHRGTRFRHGTTRSIRNGRGDARTLYLNKVQQIKPRETPTLTSATSIDLGHPISAA